MLLGKRPMKRNTSMTEFTLDHISHPSDQGAYQPLDLHNPFHSSGGGFDQQFSTDTPTSTRRSSADFTGTSHFLRFCHLCKRRLIPGRDIYMYRGDSAFCSLECRQKQMIQDERQEKCSLASKKKVSAV